MLVWWGVLCFPSIWVWRMCGLCQTNILLFVCDSYLVCFKVICKLIPR